MSELFDVLVADFAGQLSSLESLTHGGAPSLERMREVAGELFALRTGASLLQVTAVERAAAAAERALRDGTEGLDWSALQPPLRACARALRDAFEALSHADASGARIDDATPLEAAVAALDALRAPKPTVAPRSPAAAPAAPDDDGVWHPQVDADMIEPFLEEATERIESLSQKLLRLESAPGDGELVRDVFRDLHTLKGSSGFVGLRRMNRLAHAAEDLVGQLRDGTRRPDRDVIDALLGALDGLRAIADAASRAAPKAALGEVVRIEVDVDACVTRLRAPAARMVAAEPTPSRVGRPCRKRTARRATRCVSTSTSWTRCSTWWAS